MKTLVLRLRGPWQSWGQVSRFQYRDTALNPTKSGVVGLLGAALGRPRGSDMSDLSALIMAVRVDSPGDVVSDYHTAKTGSGANNTSISHRYYLEEADFLVGLRGDDETVDLCAEALRRPVWAPTLGRRSCIPSRPVLDGVSDDDLDTVMAHWDYPKDGEPRKVIRDARDGEAGQMVPDLPVSTHSHHRTFANRKVTETVTQPTTHSPFDMDWN